MNDFEGDLSKVLNERAGQARVEGASASEVRRIARRRRRRRATVGACALVLASVVGVGAILVRTPQPLEVASGDTNTIAPQSAPPIEGADVWRCAGPAPQEIPQSVPLTTIQAIDPANSPQPPQLLMPVDNFYYLTGCEPVTKVPDNAVVVFTTLAEPSDTEPMAEVSTTVGQAVPETTIEVTSGSTTTVAPNDTVALPSELLAPCLRGREDSTLELDPACWQAVVNQSTPTAVDTFLANIEAFVTGVGGFELYIVEMGDYLAGIAASYGIDMQRLADANGGSIEVALFPGHPLLIPLNG